MAKIKPSFLVFEGLDGSGTTTQRQKLATYLVDKGYPVHETCEPTRDLTVGMLIRSMLTKKTPALCARSMALLFAADRVDHLEKVVEPQLRAGSFVLSDRFVTSSYAYQDVNLDWNREINNGIHSYRRPALTFYLSVPVDVVLQRIQARDGDRRELFEQKEFLERAYQVFETECYQHDWVKVDGTMSPDKVHKEIVGAFERRFA